MFILAATYFPGGLPLEYRRREWVSLPCSGWERVGHHCYDHQKPGNLWFGGCIRFAGFAGFVGKRIGLPMNLLNLSNPMNHPVLHRKLKRGKCFSWVDRLCACLATHYSLLTTDFPSGHPGGETKLVSREEEYIKALGHLVRVSSTCHHASTSRLSTR